MALPLPSCGPPPSPRCSQSARSSRGRLADAQVVAYKADPAITLNNLGTGRIYGDHLSIAATTLNNDAEGGNAPAIVARTLKAMSWK
jgi:hypothetical protein